jgi:hypothetical protein
MAPLTSSVVPLAEPVAFGVLRALSVVVHFEIEKISK